MKVLPRATQIPDKHFCLISRSHVTQVKDIEKKLTAYVYKSEVLTSELQRLSKRNQYSSLLQSSAIPEQRKQQFE